MTWIKEGDDDVGWGAPAMRSGATTAGRGCRSHLGDVDEDDDACVAVVDL